MKFFEKIAKIETCFADNFLLKHNAKLYDIYKSPPPLAKHIIFLPMPNNIKKQLLKNYKRRFPEELLNLYSKMNGADLFWTTVKVGSSNISVPVNCLSIYGVPLQHNTNAIEPLNISVEDLNRPQGTPNGWLKFGSYSSIDDIKTRIDLFIDTDTKITYGVKHQDIYDLAKQDLLTILYTWDSLDLCLCELFDNLNIN